MLKLTSAGERLERSLTALIDGTKIKISVYDYGYSEENTRAENFEALMKAYETETPDAALFLGFYYLNGNLKDKLLALEWLQKACDANNNHSIAAHRHLAKCLMDLEVGIPDYKAAYIHNELFKFLWEHYSKEKMSDKAEGSKASIYLTTKHKVMQNIGADDLESAKSELKFMKNNYVLK